MLLTIVCCHINQIPRYRVRSNPKQKSRDLALLHLLFWSDILRYVAILIQNQIYFVKNLLIIGNFKALVVYGSLYIKKSPTLPPPIYVPALFSRKSINLAHV